MNAYMVYKVTTKVRKAFGFSSEMLWIFWTERVTLVLCVCVCRPACPYSTETRFRSRGASVIFWVCTVN